MSKIAVLRDDDKHAVTTASNLQGLEIRQGKFIIEWSVDEVIQWLVQTGFEDVAQVFAAHQISGAVIAKLTDSAMKEMGIISVGRRLSLYNEIAKVQAISRAQWRSNIIWTSDEYRPGWCNNLLPYGFPWCCECCVGPPATYKVTNSKVNVQKMRQNCSIGYVKCACCGYKMASTSYNLTDVSDVDVLASTACCGTPKGTVAVSMSTGKVVSFHLKSDECQKVSSLMINAREEAVVQEGIMMFSVSGR